MADYSQIELRLLAHHSKDAVLVEAFRNGEDIHTRTAAEVLGVPPLMVTPDMRRSAKAAPRQMLHAWKLGFRHPRTGEWKSFEAPLPDDFNQAIAATGL